MGDLPDIHLGEEQQRVLDLIADICFGDGKGMASGLELRRRMGDASREQKNAVIGTLLADVVASHGREGEDGYTLTPLGGLECKYAARIRALAPALRSFVVARYNADKDFLNFTWNDVQAGVRVASEPLDEDAFELVRFVFFCA